MDDPEAEECPVSIATEGIKDQVEVHVGSSETEEGSSSPNSVNIEEMHNTNSADDFDGRKKSSNSESDNREQLELETKSEKKSVETNTQDNKAANTEKTFTEEPESINTKTLTIDRTLTNETVKVDDGMSPKEFDVIGQEADVIAQEADVIAQEAGDDDRGERSCWGRCCHRSCYSIITLYRGWRTYVGYDAARAGLGLAFLYMTVLGFDNITVGKKKSGCVCVVCVCVVCVCGVCVWGVVCVCVVCVCGGVQRSPSWTRFGLSLHDGPRLR